MAEGLNKIVIGIAGGTGSGKTTLIERIQTEFKEGIVVLAHDYYYKDRSELELKERERLNYDHPDSFETDLLINHINKLKNGESVFRPVYDFTIHNRTKEKKTIEPEPSAGTFIIPNGKQSTVSGETDLCNYWIKKTR